MTINWFEGGRRISAFFMWAIAIGGGVYILWAEPSTVYFESSYPDDPWSFTGEDCPYPNHSEFLWRYSFTPDDNRAVSLCFRVSETERIPFRVAPTPEGAPPPAALESSVEGLPPIPGPALKWYFEGETYSAPVQDYFLQRTAAFRMTPQLESAVGDGLSSLEWKAKWQRAKDAAPWVGGLIFFIWAFTSILGWIIRGFAGIPARSDFRTGREKV